MVPLGIITIITGAIRVAGPQAAKAIIGRARENRALAEAEVMSSISHDVCEMFNGRSIIRAIGKPKIAHFLIYPPHSGHPGAKKGLFPVKMNLDNTCGIHTIKTACESGLIKREGKSRGATAPIS